MTGAPQGSAPDGRRLEHRIRIEPDGRVLALSGKIEYGQGIRTAMAQLVADELDVLFDHVQVVLGETRLVPWDVGTFGSMSLAVEGRILQLAAAHARRLLVERAIRRLDVEPAQLETVDGAVRCRHDGRTVRYVDLVAGDPLVGEIPEDVVCKAPEARRWIGRGMARVEARALVTGTARFVADVRLPGMLRGQVLRPPIPGARLRALDDRAARPLRGVVAVVRDGDFVAVVAEREQQAAAGVQALDADWDAPRAPEPVDVDLVMLDTGDLVAGFARAAHVIEASYSIPHIANAPIGPSAAVADVQPDRAVIYCGTQRPFALRSEIAAAIGLGELAVDIRPQVTSGTYGRNSCGDAALEAARLSKAVGRPVLVQWSRAEEFTLSPNRPEVEVQIKAGIDCDGRIAAWRYEELTNPHTAVAMFDPSTARATSGRNAIPLYRLPAAKVDLHVQPGEVRTGAFRSLAAAPNIFAIESMIDELAAAGGIDPLEMRLRHLDDPRMRRLLEAAAERAGWSTRPRGHAGRGYGIACAVYHGTYVAEIADVEVGDGGEIVLRRMFCALDPGIVVNPDGARNQVEGSVQQAASWVLHERLQYRNGRVTATAWENYPIATFRDAPDLIDIQFVTESGAPMTGLGEPGCVPVAAAIANAVFSGTGQRLRSLPLSVPNSR
jgi:nicotinate dehydrogenase subunit B